MEGNLNLSARNLMAKKSKLSKFLNAIKLVHEILDLVDGEPGLDPGNLGPKDQKRLATLSSKVDSLHAEILGSSLLEKKTPL